MVEKIPKNVEAAFAAHDRHLRDPLMQCRALVLDTAASTDGVGQITETLKWGQPSYLTDATKSGSTIRLAPASAMTKTDELRPALFVHCATDLIEQFKTFYPDIFGYQGKRALVIRGDIQSVSVELRHCIALALTYKLRRRNGK